MQAHKWAQNGKSTIRPSRTLIPPLSEADQSQLTQGTFLSDFLVQKRSQCK